MCYGDVIVYLGVYYVSGSAPLQAGDKVLTHWLSVGLLSFISVYGISPDVFVAL